ncbi:MAG: NTP transferase domain-containing protein, partial [Acidobacteria bacterium]|nr:NTP transferase domain-containing protein [Acidobacteriota bacterium]
MSESPRHVIVLAAGKGTRMRAARPKVLHRIGGQPLVGHVLDAASPLRAVTTTVIVGHQAEAVEAAVGALGHPRLRFVRQEPQAG